MIGYRSLYSDTYKCLTQHGNVIHSRQVEWITDAKLGVFPDISQKSTIEALERSMQAEAPGVDLCARQVPAGGSPAAAPDPSYGVLCCTLTRTSFTAPMVCCGAGASMSPTGCCSSTVSLWPTP